MQDHYMMVVSLNSNAIDEAHLRIFFLSLFVCKGVHGHKSTEYVLAYKYGRKIYSIIS